MEEKFTCQVCGRKIKAKSGLIAHHGYQRRYGWQSASCDGARFVPYEVSCDRLKEVAGWLERFIERKEQEYNAFIAERPAKLTVMEDTTAYFKGREVIYERPEVYNEYRENRPRTYECAYAQQRCEYERTIKYAKSDIAIMRRRIQEWKAPVTEEKPAPQETPAAPAHKPEKQERKWNIAYYAADGTFKDSFEWFSLLKPTRRAKRGLTYTGEYYEITELHTV